MNKISILLYLADVGQSGGIITGIFGGTLAAAGLVGSFGRGVCAFALKVEEHNEKDKSDWQEWYAFWGAMSRSLKWGIVLLLLCVVLPSKNTIYAIAASELGEKIVTNGAVQGIAGDAGKALKVWIEKQLTPETAKK